MSNINDVLDYMIISEFESFYLLLRGFECQCKEEGYSENSAELVNIQFQKMVEKVKDVMKKED